MNIKLSGFTNATALLIFVTLLSGCAGTTNRHPNQPVVPIGSKVQLNITANLPLDEDRVHVQNRNIVSAAQIDKYQIFCSIIFTEYQQSNADQLQVQPGEFNVTRVRLYNDYVHNPVIYANNDDPFWEASFGINYRTEIDLESTVQPAVRTLACTRQSTLYEKIGFYPQRPQFEDQLGEFVKLP